MAITGLELRELRLSRGLTQQQVADRLGVSRSMVAMYERGWNEIPPGREVGIERIRDLPPREDPHLLARAEAHAARARQHTVEDRTCVGCGRDFRGPYWQDTCGAPRCLHPRKGTRKEGPPTPTPRVRAMLLDLMGRRLSLEEVAERHGYQPDSVRGMALMYGVRALRIQLRRNRPQEGEAEQDRDMASRYLDGEAMEAIGEAHGITREAVRQRLAKMGASGVERRAGYRRNDRHRELVGGKGVGDAKAIHKRTRKTRRRMEGLALREARVAAGLTQQEFGELLGYSGRQAQATVSNWERGHWTLTDAAREWLEEHPPA